jgi:hypothetical protein
LLVPVVAIALTTTVMFVAGAAGRRRRGEFSASSAIRTQPEAAGQRRHSASNLRKR